MPREHFNITPPQTLTLDELQRFTAQLNTALDELSYALARVEGLDTLRAEFFNDIHLHGKRLCQVGRSRDDDDVPNRRELVENAMYRRKDSDAHVASRVIHATRGIQVPFTSNPLQVASLGQLSASFVDTSTDQTITGNKTNSGTQRNTGTTVFSGDVRWEGTTPAALAANTNNYDLGAGIAFRISATMAVNVTGIAGGGDGRLLLLINVGGFNITLVDESLDSAAPNRLHFSTGGNIIVAPEGAIALWYDDTDNRWRDWAVR